jgi:hypothetical protein
MLYALTAKTTDAPTGDEQKEGESGMASGSTGVDPISWTC